MPAHILRITALCACLAACGTTPGRLPALLPYDDGPRQRELVSNPDDPDQARSARLEQRTYLAVLLPIKPARTNDADDIERGLGLADVLMHSLSLVSRDAGMEGDAPILSGFWSTGLRSFFGANDLFATSEERSSWVVDADPRRLPSKLGKSRYRYLIGGNLHPEKPGQPRTMTLWLMDRMDAKIWSGTTTVDLPRLQRPRLLLLRLLSDAGQAPTEVERGDMLWSEELDDKGLRMVGHTAIEAAWGDPARTRAANAALVAVAPWSWVAWIDTAFNGIDDDCDPERRKALNRAFSINPHADFFASSAALGCEIGELLENPDAQIFDGMKRLGAANCAVAGKALAMIGGGREVPGSGFLAGLGGFYRGGSCSSRELGDLAYIAERATDPFVKAGLYIDAGTIAIGESDMKRAAKNFDQAKETLTRIIATEPSCLPRLYLAEAELHLGGLHLQLGRLEEASERAKAAQALGRECFDGRVVGRGHNLLGLVAQSSGHYDAALRELGQALALFEDLGDEMNMAVAKTNLGWTRVLLGQAEQALPELQAALALKHRVRSDGGEAVAMENLGVAYMTLGRFTEAEPLFMKARTLTDDPASLAAIANNLARIRAGQGLHDEARALLAEARGLAVRVHARALSATIEQTEGGIEAERGNLELAMKSFTQALAIRREVGDRAGEGLTLSSLMVIASRMDKRDLAIFYGKLAVQAHQEVKAAAGAIDDEAEEAFLGTRAQTYRKLAELLIAAGRLIEAERVMDLLKIDEVEQWTRSLASDTPTITLSKNEAELEQAYRAAADDVMAIGRQYGELAARYPLTKAEEERLAVLRKQLEGVNAKFSDFLASLGDKKIASKSIEDLREGAGIGPDLAELPGTVVVYTLIADGAIMVMVVSSDTQVAETIKLPLRFDLNDLIARFRAALQDPRADPKPLGKELYDLVVAPIAGHLEGAQARTIMWSLDKALRYVPMGALWDGKRYLAERWENALFTLASRARLKDTPQAKWRVLAAGVSKASEGFRALPAVIDELARIVDDAETREVDGALPGVTMLDEGFEREAFIRLLGAKWPVVHIASHFAFQPGDKDQSFLVLGQGRLSVTDLERIPFLFQGVDLLTLSACNTGTADEGEVTGREVEGFAVLAQVKGARAVLASLWAVADGSTSVLMQRFYALHQEGKMSKAAALRAAQLELIHGKVTAISSGVRARPLTAPSLPDEPKPPAKADWRHPYYWAPFVLMGNTR